MIRRILVDHARRGLLDVQSSKEPQFDHAGLPLMQSPQLLECFVESQEIHADLLPEVQDTGEIDSTGSTATCVAQTRILSSSGARNLISASIAP